MQKASLPENEKLRLKTLHSLKILDTSAEERFDRLTRLAKRMFNVPIALVCLIDTNRQWFKSCAGINVSETPRDISFCGHAILDEGIFIVEDTFKDQRFCDNPLVLESPYIRFYAGFPLKHVDGSGLGTLCIIDTKPRHFDEQDYTLLKDLAELAEQELIAVQLAILDDLTNISNRRGFMLLAQKSLDICARKQTPISLIFFDLNGFKGINDNFGHDEGDKALIAFADIMTDTFRDSDVFARLGGDEFAVLLTGTCVERANETVYRLKQRLDEYNKEENRGYNISFSEGIVSSDMTQTQTVSSLLSKADSLMYKNKQAHYCQQIRNNKK
ncbi:sensor domain-containing diguanylate cyclase [Psychromonas sp. KJ10-10]|uniref:sensor domain-containing diguanylate cyclase n=1 Tax=Psychromonas sp. KJ10-10 TaxID=3391823 RepID=UPI0039B3A3BC